MTFTHDTQMALTAAAALVNTDPHGGTGEDTLTSEADLEGFLDRTGWYGVRAGDATELDAVRALRPALRRLWHLEEGPLVERINEILTEAEALPQLVDHDGLGWHVHAVPQEAPLHQRMSVEAAMALIDVVRAGELDRLRTCAAEDCEDVLVDLSRNRSRRFCEGGCGNRENVRAYRDRQRTD